MNYHSLQLLEQNQTLTFLSKSGSWINVKTLPGKEGYVRQDMVSDIWVKVHKEERKLFLLDGEDVVKTCSVALCSFNPLGDKVKQGDGGTPEGRFYLCEMIRNPSQAKYGARSMRLSYPNIEDARRGLKDGLINYEIYLGIVKAIKDGRMSNQNTELGSSIRIHGGGILGDWTLGCIALDNEAVIDLFDRVSSGTRVEIYKSAKQDKELNNPDYLNKRILEGARDQLKNPALYTNDACGIIPLAYPMGDIPSKWAVCTDIVVRALRNAGIDLQALIHEDSTIHPERYRRWIDTPNYNIDHRRTRNLQIYFTYHSLALENEIGTNMNNHYQPGDIVTMDTGISNGTKFDHIGIVDNSFDNQGFPNIINIWTNGCRTDTMDLLGNWVFSSLLSNGEPNPREEASTQTYPEVVGHFRMTHPFDYQ